MADELLWFDNLAPLGAATSENLKPSAFSKIQDEVAPTYLGLGTSAVQVKLATTILIVLRNFASWGG
jgi:hypothetical protein